MRSLDGRPGWAEGELKAEFAALFPHGWAGPDVLAEPAPGGWAGSPLSAVDHPTLEQVYDEQVRMHRNLAAHPLRKPDAPPPAPERTVEEVRAGCGDAPVEEVRECRALVGLCLWDIFSDSHEVISDDRRVLSLGSFRGSGGFLADVLNTQGGRPRRPNRRCRRNSKR